MSDEPKMLTLEADPESVDVDIGDLETRVMTVGDIDRLKSAEWAKARRLFAGKADARREAIEAMSARVGKLEQVVTTALVLLIPSLNKKANP